MKKTYKELIVIGITGVILSLSACEKFVELGAPPTQVSYEDAFATDASAQSVVLGLYVSAAGNINNANMSSMTTFYPGISGDDLQYNATDATTLEFANNSLLNTNSAVSNLWSNLYQLIKNTNNAIAGLDASTSLTANIKNQLVGEAKFMRAYTYFYLVNLYGDVPLALENDNEVFENAQLPRASVEQVYMQIIEDLRDAEDKLGAAYQGTFRARVNKHAASALLARVYLYRGDYANAELFSTKVLTTADYQLPDPAVSFENDSQEIIFQIANLTGVTTFGANYITSANVVPAYTLPEAVYNSFESTPTVDLRQSNWISAKAVSDQVYYAITKYKLASGTGNEYHVVLRLAEQYLIRAEARAQQGDLAGAKADLDALRSRAGLIALGDNLSQAQLIRAVEQERLHELFGEYGHRWLDLKRTNRADEVLSAIKENWQPTSVLFPIPQGQIVLNPSLTQNPGYED